VIGGALLGAIIGRVVGNGKESVSDRGPIRIVVDADLRLRGALDWYSAPAIAPDGRSTVFEQARDDGVRMLYLRRLADINAQPIPGTEDGRLPTFSPDGRWVAFESRGAIRKVAADGGTPVVVTQLPAKHG